MAGAATTSWRDVMQLYFDGNIHPRERKEYESTLDKMQATQAGQAVFANIQRSNAFFAEHQHGNPQLTVRVINKPYQLNNAAEHNVYGSIYYPVARAIIHENTIASHLGNSIQMNQYHIAHIAYYDEASHSYKPITIQEALWHELMHAADVSAVRVSFELDKQLNHTRGEQNKLRRQGREIQQRETVGEEPSVFQSNANQTLQRIKQEMAVWEQNKAVLQGVIKSEQEASENPAVDHVNEHVRAGYGAARGGYFQPGAVTYINIDKAREAPAMLDGCGSYIDVITRAPAEVKLHQVINRSLYDAAKDKGMVVSPAAEVPIENLGDLPPVQGNKDCSKKSTSSAHKQR